MQVAITVKADLPQTRAMVERSQNLRPAMSTSVPRALRFGPGSVSDQFDRETTLDRGAGIAWAATKPFGNRKRPRHTLQATGKYRAAWLGLGPGRKMDVTENGVMIGVEVGQFPQARVFQRRTAIRVPVTAKMRRYLAAVFEVYLRKSTTALTNTPRRFAVSNEMVGRAILAIQRWIVHGKAEA